jgi:hypothetical protein
MAATASGTPINTALDRAPVMPKISAYSADLILTGLSSGDGARHAQVPAPTTGGGGTSTASHRSHRRASALTHCPQVGQVAVSIQLTLD